MVLGGSRNGIGFVMVPDTVRVRCFLAYDGGPYVGWARQPQLPSVQATLERALAQVLAMPESEVSTVCAGRTDAGVHALGQVVHADLPTDRLRARGIDDLEQRLNGVLPDTVWVYSVDLAPPGFDARFAALSRAYHYAVADTACPWDPRDRQRILQVRAALDVTAMDDAIQTLVGYHDFAAFCRHRSGATTIRTVLEAQWVRDVNVIRCEIKADAFCHSMVRSVVGACLQVGLGRRTGSWLTQCLASRERLSDIPVAPPHGLTLMSVDYPADPNLAERTQMTRARREPLV